MLIPTVRDLGGREIKGALAIEYRGYVVSMSTIPDRPEIFAWKKDNPKDSFMDTLSAAGIRYVLAKIDEELDG